jgi:hypothetical protein
MDSAAIGATAAHRQLAKHAQRRLGETWERPGRRLAEAV